MPSAAMVRRTDAAGTYTTDAGVKHKIVVFKVNPSMLDMANGSVQLSSSAFD